MDNLPDYLAINLHPLTCAPCFRSDYVWLALSLCYIYNVPYLCQPQPPPSHLCPSLCLNRSSTLIIATHRPQCSLQLHSLRHQCLTPTTCSCQSPRISHFLYRHCFSKPFIMHCHSSKLHKCLFIRLSIYHLKSCFEIIITIPSAELHW